MTKIYKKEGRRYVEIGECDMSRGYYPHGASLVWARKGTTLTRYGIDPADAALLAAAERMRDAMMVAMRKADRLQPDGKQTRLQQKAWKAYCAIAGDIASLRVTGPSLHDVVDAGLAALVDAIKRGAA